MKIDLQALLLEGVDAHQKGHLDTAASRYQRILSVAPEHADANHLLGLFFFQSQRPDDALEHIRKAISIDAKVPLYHANLGKVLKSTGNDAAAVEAFRQAVELDPKDAVLHADLASALIGAGDPDGARARAHLALELAPDLAEAHLNLGIALQELRGPTDEEAQKCFKQALALNPGLAGAHLALGVAQHEIGDTEAAIRHYQSALDLDHGFLEAHTNLGNIYRLMNNFSKARAHYQSALKIREDVAEIWGNLAVTLQEEGDIAAALDAYDRGVALSSEDPELRRNRGLARLATGHFDDGWRDYRYRWRTDRFRALVREWPVPEWTGEQRAGAQLLVHAEQGLGDTIQFARYLKVLSDLGYRVHFECPKVLHPLFEKMPYLKSLISPGDVLPKADFHIPLLNVPGLVAPDFHADPHAESYLGIPKPASKKWTQLADNWPAGKRVGIAWRGSPDHIRDSVRSPGLSAFTTLIENKEIVLVSLQKENAADELAALSPEQKIIDPTAEIEDFGDTAGLMKQLDLVVSCDSAPLHLAGALGCPSIAVLPHVAEWRWGLDGETTPWYPGMTLIRQPAFGDWESVFSEVAVRIKAA